MAHKDFIGLSPGQRLLFKIIVKAEWKKAKRRLGLANPRRRRLK